MNLLFAIKVLFFAMLGGVFILFSSCTNKSGGKGDFRKYLCSAEVIDDTDSEFFLGVDGQRFRGGPAQCENCGLRNSSGMKLDSNRRYGMDLQIFNVKRGNYFEASVYEKSITEGGKIFAILRGGLQLDLASDKASQKDSAGWVKHLLKFRVLADVDTVHFFLHAPRKEAIFDDFEILHYEGLPEVESKISGSLSIYFPESSKQVMDDHLAYCVNADVIPKSRKDYVKAYIVEGLDSHKVDIRLKGDWTDHVKSGYPSYRIKTKSDYAFKGRRSFSIQHPKTRNYMHEWFLHKLIEKEGLLTTEYDFIPVYFNDKFHGVYAFEEHFDKQLLESRNRREGPVLKMDESAFWSARHQLNEENENISIPYFFGAIPSVFKKNRTVKNPILLGNFLNGAALLDKFKNGEAIKEIFDLENAAKLYALLELGNSVHGLAWHNRRFYMNPITQKLEHIAFDLQPGYLPQNQTRLGAELHGKSNKKGLSPELLLGRGFFKDSTFLRHYLRYVRKFNTTNYLDSIFNIMNEEIGQKEALLALNSDVYQFDKRFYYERAKLVQKEISAITKKMKITENLNFPNLKKRSRVDYESAPAGYFLNDLSIKAYVRLTADSTFEVAFENYHLGAVNVLGYQKKGDEEIINISPFTLKSFNDLNWRIEKIMLKEKPKKIFFSAENTGTKVFNIKVEKWPLPEEEILRNRMEKAFQKKSKWYAVVGNEVHFKKGEYAIDQVVFIPSNYQVHFHASTHIDLVSGGGIITNGATYFKGTAESPILITASDENNLGVSIIEGEKVIINYTEFHGMNCFNQEGWVLTGGVNIYEADVTLNNVKVFAGKSEDALNIIRSTVNVIGLTINGTISDGLDLDWCSGDLRNIEIQNTGNDGADFSGSTLTLNNIFIKNAGDKAVSVGEQSTVSVTNIQITGAKIGLAAKDKSELSVTNCKFKNLEIGIACFQKKPEYGGAGIKINNVQGLLPEKPALIAPGSFVGFGDAIHWGTSKVDLESLYAEWE